jgi:hypothetical protein
MTDARDDLVERLRLMGKYLPEQAMLFEEAATRIEQLEKEVERLREALQPFATLAAEIDNNPTVSVLGDGCGLVVSPSTFAACVTLGDARRARAALNAKPVGDGG